MHFHSRRRYTDMGHPLPISDSEMQAWSSVRGRRLYDVQVKAIDALDRAYLTCVAERPADG
jgi:hypothetical protein